MFFSISASFPAISATNTKKITKEKWYEIEIIVFAQDKASHFDSEKWLEKPGFPNIRNSVEHFTPAELILANDLENLPGYQVQPDYDPKNEDTLIKYAQRLDNSSKYQLLIHRSWRQTLKTQSIYLTDKPNTDPIDENTLFEDAFLPDELTEQPSAEEMLLQALLVEEKSFDKPLTQLPFFISELDKIESFDDVRDMPVSKYTPLSYEGPPQHLVYGNFKLSKGRYLHMNLDFLYRGEPYTPIKELSVEEEFPMGNNDNVTNTLNNNIEALETLSGLIPQEAPPLVGFRIKDSKRVRLNRIYYSDHPLFGVIVRVIKYTPPPPEDDETAESDTQQKL